MPGFDAKRAAANPFHPRFVRTLLHFGALRFMAWQEANTEQLPRNWDERAKPSDRYAAAGGYLIAQMVSSADNSVI
jgi:hypothetical protein